MRAKHTKITDYKKIIYTIIFELFIACCILTGLHAKYTSELNGKSIGKIANFDVSLISQADNNISIDGIEEQPIAKYWFQITNNSQVATNCDVNLSLSQSLQDNITVTLTNSEGETYYPTISNEGKTILFSNIGNVGISQTTTFYINFLGGNHGNIISNQNIDFDVDVTINQEN